MEAHTKKLVDYLLEAKWLDPSDFQTLLESVKSVYESLIEVLEAGRVSRKFHRYLIS